MPSVKGVPIRNEDGTIIGQYFEPSKAFAEQAQKNRLPMLRADGRSVNVNRKLQAKGHYDDRHGFTFPSKAKENAK